MLSVIIPTYKNKDILFKNLERNLPYLKGCEVIVVNDYPEESLKEYLEKFKNIALIENKKNLGFGETINQGVKKAHGDYVMLLNNDVQLQDNSFIKALKYFKKNKLLFAVSFAQKEKDGSIVGKNKIYWKNGLFLHSKADDLTYGLNGWAEGGSCIVDKEKFLKLGGFDPIYKPFYWEDIDMSYRAKQAGYHILFVPEITVKHHHESTIGRYFSKNFIKTIAFRNQFLFIWKNIRGTKIISHFLFLPFNIVYYSLKGEFAFIIGLFKALQVMFRHE